MALLLNEVPRARTQRTLGCLLLLLIGASAGCGGSGSGSSDWESIAAPRPSPLDGAPRVMVRNIEVEGGAEDPGATVSLPETLEELIGAGLLRRRDVHFQERRRFLEAVRNEEAGVPRPRGAPPIGTSAGTEVLLSGTWRVDRAQVALRLVDVETSEIIRSGVAEVPLDAEAVSVARVMVGWMTQMLEEQGRIPAWDDPIPASAPPSYIHADVPPLALEHFRRGVEAEDGYDWEGARVAYQAASEISHGRFFEADVALARVGRMRSGGTLGDG